MFNLLRKKKQKETLDDVSYIEEMKQKRGLWQQYDVLLAANGYGWDYMVATAAYMESADLDDISSITISEMANMPETELIDSYRKTQGYLKDFEPLSIEKGQLAIAGISRTLKAPVKIVMFNQTRVLRVFTIIDDRVILLKYIETIIRRSFGTKDAMKLAKPVSKKK